MIEPHQSLCCYKLKILGVGAKMYPRQASYVSSFAYYTCHLHSDVADFAFCFSCPPCTGMHAQLLQWCPTLCDPMDCSPPGSSVHRISQARILEWVAISFLQGIFPAQGLNPACSSAPGNSLCTFIWGFPGGSEGKESVCNARDLGQEDPLEKEMATHVSILAWRIPWTEEPGRLQFMGSQRVGHH